MELHNSKLRLLQKLQQTAKRETARAEKSKKEKTMPGHEVKFVNPLLNRHECPICLYAMKNPVQTECGHLFCRECLDPILKRKRPICPIDKEEINPDSIFPDNACRREILNLEVYCNFTASGCQWVGPLKNLEVQYLIFATVFFYVRSQVFGFCLWVKVAIKCWSGCVSRCG